MGTKILNNRLDLSLIEYMKKLLFKYRLLVIIIFQAFIVISSYAASFYIRFDFAIPSHYIQIFYSTLPFLIICRLSSYYFYRIHSGSWRYASMKDLMDTVKAVLLGTILFLTLMVFVYRLGGYPRSIFILDTIINFLFIGGSRFAIRYYYESNHKDSMKINKNVLIAGAGKAGVLILNEVRTNRKLGIRVVGFVDDNPFKKGSYIQGIPVLGETGEIPEIADRKNCDEVIIAIPSARYKDTARIFELAKRADMKTRVLPSLGKLIQDDSFMNQLRDVSCDDLLGRKVLKFSRESDTNLMKEEVNGKAVLVTGAGGSIGSELCRQVAELCPSIIILYERHENSLYDIEIELRRKYPGLHILPVIGDILDSNKLDGLLRGYHIDLIYHAAAYKHVPMMEREPYEAIRNNVIGSRNIADLAVKNKVKKFVLISTDKAVNPANIMGATKRVAELITQKSNGNGTKFIAVRFGNVIGSNGSVIPLFKKQIMGGGPVTVTDPEMTRYFMAIKEAVQLVMIAGSLGKGGEIFLLDMGEPIKIIDLARELIRRSGLEPEKDIDIIFTGLRPGEKLHEELYWEGDGIIPTENKKITMLKPNGPCSEKLFHYIGLLEERNAEGELKEALRLLKEIVPESTIKDEDIQLEALSSQ